MKFPITRLRRLRYNSTLRNLVSENILNTNDLVYPLFVCEGHNIKNEIKSMPGQYQLSIDMILKKIQEAILVGVESFILFPISSIKDSDGFISTTEKNILYSATKKIKSKYNNIVLILDICNCAFTNHGHCGTVVNEDVDNDLTIKNLALQSVLLAKAGADVIAPSDMMDGRISVIRHELDVNGFNKVPIISYSAKFASSFYGPFREASDSSPKKGDRSTYQLSYTNSREAIREGETDLLEGADMLMIKPAMLYLDIISEFRKKFNIPIVAFNVSGEYSMVKLMSKNNLVNEIFMILEVLTSIKRAGASIIITYHALEVAEYIKNKNEI